MTNLEAVVIKRKAKRIGETSKPAIKIAEKPKPKPKRKPKPKPRVKKPKFVRENSMNVLVRDKRQIAMLNALELSLGVVTMACKHCGIDQSTHYRWLKQDEKYLNAVLAIEDITLDFAESHLHKQIRNGNVSATIFFLKTKGKKRGYIELTQIEEVKPTFEELKSLSDDDLQRILNE
jgi:hypothetical protein